MPDRKNIREPGPDADNKPTGQPAPSAARSRTVDALRKILAAGAMTGATFAAGADDPIVCDPLPPPMQCPSELDPAFLQSSTWWQAKWVIPKGQKKLAIELSVGTSGRQGSEILLLGSNVKVTDAAVLSLNGAPPPKVADTKRGPRAAVVFVPEQGKKSVTVTLPVTCDEIAGALQLKVDVTQKPEEGRVVLVSIERKAPAKK